MSYISKSYMNNADFTAVGGSSFDSRINAALMPKGVEWRTPEAVEAATRAAGRPVQHMEAILDEMIAARGHAGALAPAAPTQRTALRGGAVPVNEHGLPEGMTWVSPSGQGLLPLRGTFTARQQTERGMRLLNHGKQPAHVGAQAYVERSMDLWRVVNPGCMPEYTKTPHSTTHDTYEYDSRLNPPVDKRHHAKKNDFTEHTENGLSVMKALISDKK